MECRHLNNKRNDPRACNLEWATKKVNESDKVKFGTIRRGSMMDNAKLSESVVIAARDRARNGEPMGKIAADYGINPRQMASAIVGRRWGWLPGATGAFVTRRKFTEQQIVSIRERAKTESQASIAREYGVRHNTIGQIVRGESYAHVRASD